MAITCFALLEMWSETTLPCGSWERPLAHWTHGGNKSWLRAKIGLYCVNDFDCLKPFKFILSLDHPRIYTSGLLSYFLKCKLVRAIKDSFQTVNAFKTLSLPKKMQLLFLSVLNYLLCSVSCDPCEGYMNNSLLHTPWIMENILLGLFYLALITNWYLQLRVRTSKARSFTEVHKWSIL